jgi:hypothetical protein
MNKMLPLRATKNDIQSWSLRKKSEDIETRISRRLRGEDSFNQDTLKQSLAIAQSGNLMAENGRRSPKTRLMHKVVCAGRMLTCLRQIRKYVVRKSMFQIRGMVLLTPVQ